jgi:tetratricopeptide (TPR) repeat protein
MLTSGIPSFIAATVLLVSMPVAGTFAADPLNSPRNVCFDGGFSDSKVNAQHRMADCSEALQSHKLSPTDVALARLYRGAARMKLGDTIMASADYVEALKHYDSAIDPRNPDALELYRRAAALDALGQTDRALGDYSDAIRLDPTDPLAFLGRGVLFASRQRLYERAVDDFDKVLVLAPNNVDGLMHRGDAYSQMGNFGPALADLDRAVALAPDNAEAYVYRGLVNSRRNENGLAMFDYKAGLALDPDNVDALVNLAAIYSTNGEQTLAIADLDAAIALRKDDPRAFYNRGYAHFANRQYDLAAADYSSAIALDPTMGLAYTNRCLILAIVGKDLVGALGDCDKALKLMPNNTDVRGTRAFVYLKMGEAEIAIREFNAALEIKPDQALSLYGRGLAQLKAGHAREGAADKASALALDPAIARQFSGYGLE